MVSSATHVKYADLEAAVRARSIDVARGAPALPLDANGQALNARFMVRGCRIGQAVPYLRKLKEAPGSGLSVIAP